MTPSPLDDASLTTTLGTLAENPDLGVFHGHVTSIGSGSVVFDRASEVALRPASVTKVLTASAALLSLGAQDRITTEVVRGADPAAVTIKAAGDVWLDAEAMDALAEQIGHADAVYIDTSVWDGMAEMLPGWNPLDIDGGYVAPMQPAMLSG
ncbi:D-alanyl-D-alanine carboxypeptidase/D-alanyl-D-alanine-endopeptidase, partial [Acinetobacter baumannii]|nr:D-alanyl-D-alanine carboxypeptidase/D-alanyl-D-alanine-endopeptidase [Acinetobacter baumannii]